MKALYAILIVFMLAVGATVANAQTKLPEPPAAAKAKLPILVQELDAYWPALTMRDFIGGQIEQESCIHLKHRFCWSEKAQLKTPREQGVGLGQLTRAFHPDGRVRFDAMGELKAKYPRELRYLTWDNWSDARLQLRAVVLKDRDICKNIKNTATEKDQMLMCLVAYNGGPGGLKRDRVACSGKSGCNPALWYGHVELTSLKSRVKMVGYGRSPYEISREYPKTIDHIRRKRYHSLNR